MLTTTILYSPAMAAVQLIKTRVLFPSFSRTCTCLLGHMRKFMKEEDGGDRCAVDDEDRAQMMGRTMLKLIRTMMVLMTKRMMMIVMSMHIKKTKKMLMLLHLEFTSSSPSLVQITSGRGFPMK